MGIFLNSRPSISSNTCSTLYWISEPLGKVHSYMMSAYLAVRHSLGSNPSYVCTMQTSYDSSLLLWMLLRVMRLGLRLLRMLLPVLLLLQVPDRLLLRLLLVDRARAVVLLLRLPLNPLKRVVRDGGRVLPCRPGKRRHPRGRHPRQSIQPRCGRPRRRQPRRRRRQLQGPPDPLDVVARLAGRGVVGVGLDPGRSGRRQARRRRCGARKLELVHVGGDLGSRVQGGDGEARRERERVNENERVCCLVRYGHWVVFISDKINVIHEDFISS